MSDPGLLAVRTILIIPAVSALLLAFLPDDRATARLNALAALATLACAIFHPLLQYREELQ